MRTATSMPGPALYAQLLVPQLSVRLASGIEYANNLVRTDVSTPGFQCAPWLTGLSDVRSTSNFDFVICKVSRPKLPHFVIL